MKTLLYSKRLPFKPRTAAGLVMNGVSHNRHECKKQDRKTTWLERDYFNVVLYNIYAEPECARHE